MLALIGAGAIISHLSGKLSPEAVAAVAAFQEARPKLAEHLAQCSSGKELIERGFADGVNLASELNTSRSAPVLVDAAYVRGEINALPVKHPSAAQAAVGAAK
jgi:2-phosphosulfolactate phosphatase